MPRTPPATLVMMLSSRPNTMARPVTTPAAAAQSFLLDSLRRKVSIFLLLSRRQKAALFISRVPALLITLRIGPMAGSPSLRLGLVSGPLCGPALAQALHGHP